MTPQQPDDLNVPDEEVVAFLRRFLPDFYFVNAPLSRMKRHRTILKSLPGAPGDAVIEFHHAPGASFSELVLCARDPAQPGLLSNIAAALAALGVNVHTAWIHSLDDPSGNGDRLALDTFILSESAWNRSRALSAKTQKDLAELLARVLSGEQNADELLLGAGRSRQKVARAALRVSDASAARADNFSLFRLRVLDSRGVFLRITRALAGQNVIIEHAQINTFEHEADDVFFVLDAQGAPFSDEDAGRIINQLRDELSRSE